MDNLTVNYCANDDCGIMIEKGSEYCSNHCKTVHKHSTKNNTYSLTAPKFKTLIKRGDDV